MTYRKVCGQQPHLSRKSEAFHQNIPIPQSTSQEIRKRLRNLRLWFDAYVLEIIEANTTEDNRGFMLVPPSRQQSTDYLHRELESSRTLQARIHGYGFGQSSPAMAQDLDVCGNVLEFKEA